MDRQTGEVLRPLVPWLTTETIHATMDFPNTTCVVDCSEILLQKLQNLVSSCESSGHYHSQNTMKYLVTAAPCGLIMFISAVYGGRCSDKFITLDSGILDYLMPGDEVMTGRGLTIKDSLFERKIKMVAPSFRKKHGPLTEEQKTRARQNARILIERAIRCLQNTGSGTKKNRQGSKNMCALVNLRVVLSND